MKMHRVLSIVAIPASFAWAWNMPQQPGWTIFAGLLGVANVLYLAWSWEPRRAHS